MKRLLAALVAGTLAGAAVAKLPPPTPEEKAQLEKKKEDKKAQTERQKKELEQAQDRVARQYRAQHGQGEPPAEAKAEKLKSTDVPKSARQPPGEDAHPYAGRKSQPQGQAHSSD